jgi:predicted enzyme related to lactoylglutathione lyase
MTKIGRNVWFDLMTPDMEGSKRFYSEAIGWRTEQWKDGDPKMPYTMWLVGETPMGGLMPLPDEAKRMGAPPMWMAYTTVEDVDATMKRVVSLGGSVNMPAFDVHKAGRMAYVADPQGAAFAVFAPVGEDMPAMDRKQHGVFGWSELNTNDADAAWGFYQKLFGWNERGSMDMGPDGKYQMFQDPTQTTMGGISNAAQNMKLPPHWLHYITVDDMGAALQRIKGNGGKVVHGPMEVPENDVIAQCVDPQGAYFAVFARKK